MNYSGMPMGMWYLYEKSFRDKLVSVMGYDQETADGAAKKAKWKYKSIIDKLPEFEKEDRFKMNIVRGYGYGLERPGEKPGSGFLMIQS